MSEFLREPAPRGKDNGDYNDDGDGDDEPGGTYKVIELAPGGGTPKG